MKNIKNNSILLLFLLILAPFLASAQAGCTDNDACNFDPNALIDDGTCSYYVDCAGICGGNYILDVCGNCYDPAAQNGIIDFQYTGGLQYWTVPDGVTEIIVDAWGAEGGTSTGQNGGQNFLGGRGAHIQGTFTVNAGEVITILVGQKGADGNCGSGGGGGSFVVFNGNPLAIAGGGGGGFHCNVLGGNPGAHGLTSTNGGDGVPPPTHPSPYFRPARVGGANGNGGSSAFGSGGGGWLTAGTSNYGGTGGGAYPGAGGVPGGGYGGGGSYYSGCCGGSGGGGGYSGGSGGESDGCAGGGGGSWNAGLNQLNESGVRTGNGLVSITFNAIPACPGGCMDPLACNFDPSAEIEDGSCIYPDGCTDENACNFSPDALCDNGSCVFPGCDDPSACNYDPDAGCSDNSCAYVIDCAGVCGGNFVQDLCGNCYDPNALNDNLDFAYTGGLQYWTVPVGVNEIIIDAWGAEGGTSTGQNGGQNFIGGLGAHVQGTFTVNPGDVLEILVGQKGANGSCGSGGGGGSFVVFNGNPLAIAGGGGGGFHCNVLGGNPGGHGLTSTNGGDGTPPPTHPSPYFRPARVGGANGNGGSSAFGSGGGGWLTAGTSNYGGTGGGAYPGAGGVPGGGYGGGGSYYSGCCGGSGGGGGYSGGSGGESDGCSGGGGGSWNAGLNQLNESGVRLGDGLVSISFAGIPECPQGCTDPIACNYDPEAQLEDGSCIYPDGCTDANACNFDPSAICDDGTCTFPGCDDPSACNYDPDAGCSDNSCAFIIDCAGVCGGNFIEDLCGNCYDPNAVNGSTDFGYSGNLQYWTVPEGVTEIIIDAWGAEGGTSTGQNGGQNFIGGRGAHVQGTFLVNPGEVLEILVGQKGANGSCGSGGGGGSFVVFNGNPLAIAGGGGGGFHCNVLGGNPGGHGLTSTNGGDGTPPPTHPSPYFRPARVGGANGNGGSSAFGSGGGGWLTAGTSNYGGTGGGAYPGAGGSPGGGYGGGGSYYSGCCGGSGGGGGYSGGSGGESDGCSGGGGGSWNAGLNQLNESGVRLGDGLVSISFAGIPECPQGCTDPNACNYDPEAQLEDGSCIYPDGCTDASACNFDPSATCDNATCTYPGCDDISACNYDPEAGCSDGSCIYIIDCAGVCGGDFILDDCGNCYDPDAATGEVLFDYTGSLQYWTVPEGITEIIIDAWGAEGGTSTGQNGGQNFVGGLGAHIQGTFLVNPGEVLEILVGQKGANGSCGSGGGGGSFVVFNGNPLAIAGGGGGGFHCNVLGGNPGGHGLTSTNGGDGTPPPTHPSPYFRPARVGGANGNGGSSAFGSGGGGWLTAGTSNYGGTGGGAYPGAGGSPGGGYGGGGSYYSGCCGGSGGGGGYSGGSGGESDGCSGGGGGSWNAGLNQVNESGVRTGNGLVVISFADAPLCLPGCTNPLAQNYDSEANFDDGSCLVPGCTDPNAENYNPQAIQDDGSCVYAGCTYPDALNFDPQATIDDGSCEFPAVGCGPGTYYDEVSMLCLPLPLDCPSDINADGLVNTADLLELLSDFGNSCP